MKKRLLQLAAPASRPFALLLFSLLLLLTGCSPIRSITRDVTGSGGELKKKIGVTVFENRTAVAGDDLRKAFQSRLTAKITRACSDVLLVTPEDRNFPEYLTNLPRLSTGLVDNHALAVSGREDGFNAVVSGSLLNMKVEEKSYGFWWFKSSRPAVELLVGAQAYDIETGAKILDQRFGRTEKISEAEFESLRTGSTGALSVLSDPLQQIADAAGESICDAVSRQPWKGHVISVSTGKVILSSGKDTGLVPGDVLEVYNSGQIISGHGGQQFFVPGVKAGEIRISAVYPNRSEAVVISGGGIKEGFSVKRR